MAKGTRAAIINLDLTYATILPSSSQVQVKVPLEDICIDDPVKFVYAQGAVKVVGSIFHASAVASAAMKVVMPTVSELTDDISVWRECPVLTWNSRQLV